MTSRASCAGGHSDLLVRQGMHEEATGPTMSFPGSLPPVRALHRCDRAGLGALERAGNSGVAGKRTPGRTVHSASGPPRPAASPGRRDVDAALRYGRDLLAIDPASTANTVAR